MPRRFENSNLFSFGLHDARKFVSISASSSGIGTVATLRALFGEMRCLYQAEQTAGIRRAALVAHEGRRILAVELDKGAAAGTLAALREVVRWAQVDSVIVLRKIPVDKHHNLKVNYPELHKKLSH